MYYNCDVNSIIKQGRDRMEKITLSNGLTVALDQKPQAHSAAVSIFVAAGNRFETLEFCGASHFIEHMVFKGTTSKASEDIARESDMMGGQLNAYTTKEYTCFYSRALTEHVPKTLHLLCDMICNPLFDAHDIETEKGVVLEEIGMYEDSPEDHCSDMLTALCYKDKPLGYNILGTRESVQSLTADELRRYMAKTYVPERIVVSLCGNFDRENVLEILDGYFGSWQNTHNPIAFEQMNINSGLTLCNRQSEQTQVAFCFNGLPHGHELRYASAFFSSIIGGAASSKINRRIREELGLAYSAYSFTSNYLGTGLFGVSAGLAPKNQEKFFYEVQKILKECTKISKEEVEMTREQFKAGLVLSNESMSSIASSTGRQLLLDNKYTDLDAILKKVNEVTLDEVLEVGKMTTDPESIALSVVGEAHDEGFYRKMLDSFRK